MLAMPLDYVAETVAGGVMARLKDPSIDAPPAFEVAGEPSRNGRAERPAARVASSLRGLACTARIHARPLKRA